MSGAWNSVKNYFKEHKPDIKLPRFRGGTYSRLKSEKDDVEMETKTDVDLGDKTSYNRMFDVKKMRTSDENDDPFDLTESEKKALENDSSSEVEYSSEVKKTRKGT